jgi:hypothetical protein
MSSNKRGIILHILVDFSLRSMVQLKTIETAGKPSFNQPIEITTHVHKAVTLPILGATAVAAN